MYGTRKWFLSASLSVAVLIGWHNLSALMYMPVVIMYPLLLKFFDIKNFTRKRIFFYYVAVLAGIAITSFFWIPALLESRYTLAFWLFPVQQGYRDHFLAFWQLIWSTWGYGFSLPGTAHDGMSFQAGIAHWVVFLAGIVSIAGWLISSSSRCARNCGSDH